MKLKNYEKKFEKVDIKIFYDELMIFNFNDFYFLI